MFRKINPVFVSLLVALLTINTIPAQAAVNTIPTLASKIFYVSPSGNDSNPGTPSQPWKTISKAARTLTVGDIVYLRGGIYKEVVYFDTSGTQSQPIQIIAYPGEVPIVDGDNYRLPSSWSCLISLKGNYIQISGVELRYSNYCGLGISGKYVQASNINSHHNKENGIIAQGDYDIVENSLVWWNAMSNEYGSRTRSSWASGLSAARHPNNVTLRGNIVYNNWGEGLSTYEANGTIIEDNTIYDNWSANVYISDATNVLFQRNLIYASDNSAITSGTRAGIMMGDERYTPSSSNITIINNFVYGTYRNLWWWKGLQGGGMANVLVANNTFVNSRAEAGIVIASGSHSNTRIFNNLVLQEGSLPLAVVGSQSGLTFSNNLWSKTPPSAVAGIGDVTGNPQLVRSGQTNAGQLNGSWFEIQSTSPARSKAKVLNEVIEDYYTNSRDTSPDIGAHEYGAPATKDLDVFIGANKMGAYSILQNSTLLKRYSNKSDGPVKVISTNGMPILTSQRAFYGNSFNELMGYPADQFTTEYWFPWYDNVFMQTWILVGNPSATQTANVEIYIGGQLQLSSPIPPTGRITPMFGGVLNGPVRVVCTNCASYGGTIFASERSLYGDSFSEVMGYPANQFTTEYWFPWYDNVYMQTWILVGNPSATETANVDIYVGGVMRSSHSIPPGGRVTPQYPDLIDGPVQVISSNGVNIFASQRSLYGSSFNEVMGYPQNQLTTEYWYTLYDQLFMQMWVLVGNPSTTQTASVDIYIGGVKQDSYTIPPNGRVTPQFSGVYNGPVQVISTNSVPIFTSERTLYGSSFNEMMGYPADQFTTEYWFTWYDNIYMQTNLAVSKP